MNPRNVSCVVFTPPPTSARDDLLRARVETTYASRTGSGRLAAREVLLNTPAVAALIADGRTARVPVAIEEGRKIGMISLNESLAALVKNSSVDAREAYRCAGDRQGLLALFKRQGVDTTLVDSIEAGG